MSKNLRANEVAQFDGEVKHAYQGFGVLRGTVRLKTGIIGATHRFPKMGKGTATPRVPQTDVVPMNIAHTNATLTIEDWNAPEYTDIFDQQKVNFQERNELAEVIAGAITRREDQLILDALDAASSTLTVAKTVGATDGFDVTQIRRAARLLNDQGVGLRSNDPRAMVISPTHMEQLLGSTAAISADFNTVRALVNGEVNTFVRFTFMQIEARTEGGLPLSGTDRTWYAYAKSSTGLGIGIDFTTNVDHIPEKTSWLANGLFAAGAVAIDALGIVEGVGDEAITIDSA